MKCINCGKEIKEGSKKCPECGAELVVPKKKGDEEVPISTAIATVLVIIFITCAVIGFYFAYGKDKLSESNMRRQLLNSGEQIIEMYYDDFNCDGTKEAYAITGSGSANNILNGKVWYLREASGTNVKSDFTGSINGIVVEKGQKYVSIEIKDENGESVSYICGVNKYGDYTAAPASERFSGVHQTDGRILTESGKEISILNPQD